MIIIDSSVWIPLLRGAESAKVARARDLIEGPEDIGVPGVVLEEVLWGLRSDAQFRRIGDLLLDDFEYVEMTRRTFIRSAEIYRRLWRGGRTIRSPIDCLIAACAVEQDAALLEEDADFPTIAGVCPLVLVMVN
jgi:predicted nucleic acid-binding protein